MGTRYRIDPESFEALLANACAVQQSGLGKQSLTDLMEIQRFLASEGFDFDDQMRMVVDRVLKFSKAGGVAIALLESDQLVYRAGVGSAAKEIGRRVAAVLKASSSGDLRQEILRVEDASHDKRIEADICRQFGARSLFMLPICENGVLRGVLQLSFEDAHSFSDHEIRVYRLMAGALEEGILRRQRQAEKHEMSVAQAADVEANSTQGVQTGDEFVTSPMVPASKVRHNALFQVHSPMNTANHLAREQSQGSQVGPALAYQNRSRPSAVPSPAVSSRASSADALLWCFHAAIGAVVVLGVMIWISTDYHSITSTGPPNAALLREKEESASDKPLPAKQARNTRRDLRETIRRIPEFKQVWISSDEVDDIAEDVTIRHFTAKSLRPQSRKVVKEVNLGDDVTVRYFANGAPAVFKPSLPGSGGNPKLRQP